MAEVGPACSAAAVFKPAASATVNVEAERRATADFAEELNTCTGLEVAFILVLVDCGQTGLQPFASRHPELTTGVEENNDGSE